ncbi:hypothetical protein HK102_006942 [Quaeritorhiza haematococci]|nr:hypothetical protein HK102_006942 [Quaeritorhiza haematococci]
MYNYVLARTILRWFYLPYGFAIHFFGGLFIFGSPKRLETMLAKDFFPSDQTDVATAQAVGFAYWILSFMRGSFVIEPDSLGAYIGCMLTHVAEAVFWFITFRRVNKGFGFKNLAWGGGLVVVHILFLVWWFLCLPNYLPGYKS